MKRLLFIFNPCAGRAKVKNKLYEIIEHYTRFGYLVTVYPTSAKRDAYSFLMQSEEMYELIVCGGGDGTLNEVASGILDAKIQIPLAYIPTGSTNDFARSIGISTDIDEALEITLHKNLFDIDIGVFNQNKFVYIAAFGIFTNIPYSTSQKMKNTLGYLAYVLEGIKAISELKAYNLTLKYDAGNVEGAFIVGLIMNSFSVAGFKNPFHQITKLNDGLFEVLLIRMPQNILELQAIIAALMNERVEPEYMVCFQTSSISISSEPIEWTFDGEYGGVFDLVSISILNRALQVIMK